MPSPPGRKPIQVTGPVHAALARRAGELSAELGRTPTFSEVIERLFDDRDQLLVELLVERFVRGER